DYLHGRSDEGRRCVLTEPVRAERELRRSAGESPGAEEDRRRFPDDRAAVEAAFGPDDRGDPASPGTPATAAHSLLLGLLALQNNFIARDSLLALRPAPSAVARDGKLGDRR